jgi:hypothetical protein
VLKAIFTLDYEIHGNGDGSPRALMVEPTSRLLRLFDDSGAKLTIMADIAEILRFKQYADEVGRDDFYSRQIERQLQTAVLHGHDVQLHIHSSYFGARCENGRWVQNWREYDFASLPPDRMSWMISRGKQYLESLLRPIDPNYRCEVFRAANWSVMPSPNVVRALLNNGIRIDTSVFKYGRRNGNVRFDYSSAFSALVPWRVDATDMRVRDDNGRLWEFPIYSEERTIAAFLTPQRFHRAIVGRLHALSKPPGAADTKASNGRDGALGAWKAMLRPHAWKADFNQCTGRQLIAAIERASESFRAYERPLPFVLIGHSKLFSRFNEWSLRPFISHIRGNPDRFEFGKFGDFLAASPEHGDGRDDAALRKPDGAAVSPGRTRSVG